MQETDQAAVQPQPNPVTMAAHRRQVLWQITLPVAVVVLVIVLAAAGVVWAGSRSSGETTTSLWADVSILWLIAPMLILMIIVFAVCVGVIYLLRLTLRGLPLYSRQLQDILFLVSYRVRKASDAAVEPVLRAHSFSASLRSLRRKKPKDIE